MTFRAWCGCKYIKTKFFRDVSRGFVAVSVDDNVWNRKNSHQLSNKSTEIYSDTMSSLATLGTLQFDNLALRTLPVDRISDNYTRSVSGACFSRVAPTPVDSPETVAFSSQALLLLDLPDSEAERPEFPYYFSGNKLFKGSEPASHCYCGHQFGAFSGQLGDGAAIYLGEIINKKGERWELQLKGAGKTPYSRQADGRKVLRSSIREFLCSEAMYNLGIPTTRAGSCITSSSTVVRDIFYDGHPIQEKCTIVSRIAPTFIRFGSFEIFKTCDSTTGRSGPSVGQFNILKELLEYTISTFYPEINNAHESNDVAKYRAFFKEVMLRTIRLVASWQCVGFCHGVLNTDNMSIVGLTIDYGPFGFMDRYYPDFICNSSDDGGRYSYSKQPEMCKWNLTKLAEALSPFLPLEQSMEELAWFDSEYQMCYLDKMRKKLGLTMKLDGDKVLVENFLAMLETIGADFTNSFRSLSCLNRSDSSDHDKSLELTRQKLLDSCCSREELLCGLSKPGDPSQLQFLMLLYNTQPQILEQIGKGKEVIERELQRQIKFRELQTMTREEKCKKDVEKIDEWLKIYDERISQEKLSNGERASLMNANNPRIVLRNYIAQNAITQAEKRDYSEVRRVLKIFETPFSGECVDNLVTQEASASAATKTASQSCKFTYESRPPAWASGIRVS